MLRSRTASAERLKRLTLGYSSLSRSAPDALALVQEVAAEGDDRVAGRAYAAHDGASHSSSRTNLTPP